MTERVGAIVLAGGRSSRFGRDKLAEPLDGRPLLHHAIAGVRTVAADIVVVAAPGARLVVPDGVTLVHDATAFAGPLAAIEAGLAATGADRVVIVGGDMPSLVPAVLGHLLASVGDEADAAILGADGPRAILPMAVSVSPARSAVHRLVTAGERRLGALLDTLDPHVVPAALWRVDDPDGRTLRDVDRPIDLHPADSG